MNKEVIALERRVTALESKLFRLLEVVNKLLDHEAEKMEAKR